MVTRPATPPYSSTTIAMWFARHAELAQQHVETLDSGHEDCGAQHVAQVELAPGEVAQQVLASRMPTTSSRSPIAGKREWAVSIHLGDHFDRVVQCTQSIWARGTITSLTCHVGHLQGAFENGEGVGVDQVALEGRVRSMSSSSSRSSWFARASPKSLGNDGLGVRCPFWGRCIRQRQGVGVGVARARAGMLVSSASISDASVSFS